MYYSSDSVLVSLIYSMSMSDNFKKQQPTSSPRVTSFIFRTDKIQISAVQTAVQSHVSMLSRVCKQHEAAICSMLLSEYLYPNTLIMLLTKTTESTAAVLPLLTAQSRENSLQDPSLWSHSECPMCMWSMLPTATSEVEFLRVVKPHPSAGNNAHQPLTKQ